MSLNVTPQDTNTILLSWDPPDIVWEFYIEISESDAVGNLEYNETIPGNDSSVTVGNLSTPGMEYDVTMVTLVDGLRSDIREANSYTCELTNLTVIYFVLDLKLV